MVTKERIEQYKEWFSNLSFFGRNSFVIDNIEFLWNYVKRVDRLFHKISRDNLKKIEYTKLETKEVIDISQKFLDNYDIKIKIKELIDEGILVIENKEKIKNEYYNTIQDGIIHYDKDNNKVKIELLLDDSIFDCGVLIHELMHYLNQPKENRNIVSDLLTEAVSYSIEMIFYEDMKNLYPNDYIKTYYGFIRTLNTKIYYSYYIYKITYLYKIKKDINEELYKEVFDDEYYEETIDAFEKYASNRNQIFKDTWNVISLPLATYILEKYNNKEMRFDSIIEFSDSINDKSIEECIKIVGIDSKDDFFEKTIEAVEKGIEKFNKIIEEMN